MRKSTITAVLAACALLTVAGAAQAGRYDRPSASASSADAAFDGASRAGKSYKAGREHKRTYVYKRTKRERQYAYPFGPWGPFDGPPGLF